MDRSLLFLTQVLNWNYLGFFPPKFILSSCESLYYTTAKFNASDFQAANVQRSVTGKYRAMSVIELLHVYVQ